eukprot:812724-Prymnesium_polylepis.1
MMNITVFSAISTAFRDMEVSLSVQARTESIQWGEVSAETNYRCVVTPQATLGDDEVATVGELRRVAFTACDVDLLPVDHQLPSQSDDRKANVTIVAFGSSEGVTVPI